MNTSDMLYFLQNAVVAFVVFLVASLIFRKNVFNLLTQNGLGWFLMIVAVLAVAISSYTTKFWYSYALTIGGFLFGLGALIAMPDPWNKKLYDWKLALRWTLFVGGLYFIINNVLVVLFGDSISELWGNLLSFGNDVWSKMSWQVAGWLVLGILLVAVSAGPRISGYLKRRQSRARIEKASNLEVMS